MKFVTATGSIYEVNTDSKKIRRLSGVKDPQPRQGNDGEWKPYLDLMLNLGSPAYIFWDSKTTPLLEGSSFGSPATVTSIVKEIEL